MSVVEATEKRLDKPGKVYPLLLTNKPT